MAKKRQDPSSSNEPQPTKPTKKKVVKKRPSGELPWHPFWRWLVSLLVVLHLLAVFCAPWALSTPPALPPGFEAADPAQPLPPPNSVVWQKPIVVRGLHGFFNDYLNLLYLNHGYEFFAPDPAGTHVIDFEVTKADGIKVSGRIPSHELHWPRLLYHRHMMLSDQSLRPEMVQESPQFYADHVATVHGGTSQLAAKAHLLLPPHRVADETPLDAPSTYRLIGQVQGTPRQPKTREPLPASPSGAQP